MSESIHIIILLLQADLSIFVVLAGEEQVIGLFNFEVVTGTQRMHQSLLAVFVLH